MQTDPSPLTALPLCKCNDTTTPACGFSQDKLITLLKEAPDNACVAYTRYFEYFTCTTNAKMMDHCKKCSKTIDMHAPSTEVPSMMADIHCVVQFILPLASVGLIPRATSRDTSVPQDIKKTMLRFYKTRNCVILRKLLLKGKDATERFEGEIQPCYPAVHAHVIPQAEVASVAFLGIDVDDPQNALPLFKHIELEWDRGNIALIPVAGTADGSHLNVLVKVAQALRGTKMCFASNGDVMYDQPIRNITFQQIHNVTISFEAEARPYVRCLILRWETSYRKNPHEFPVPTGDDLRFLRRDPEHKEAIKKWDARWDNVVSRT